MTAHAGKRLSAERLATVQSHYERYDMWLTRQVSLRELLDHIAAVEAEFEERLHKETHEHIDTKIDLEHANDVADELEAENARLREALLDSTSIIDSVAKGDVADVCMAQATMNRAALKEPA